jgi:hypothetical protein
MIFSLFPALSQIIFPIITIYFSLI